jgi:hypothetical protein
VIKYALTCENGHGFEGWFANSAAWESQMAEGRLECPGCGSARIDKAPMAPNLAKGDSKGGGPAENGEAVEAVREMIRQVRSHVQNTAEYVGDRFPEEARKIHYEEKEKRDIYGEASVEEANELREDGVEVYPLPTLPEDQN